MFTQLARIFLKRTLNHFIDTDNSPIDAQKAVLRHLCRHLGQEEYGKRFGLKENESYESFTQKCPLSKYEDLAPYLERLSDDILAVAQTSGTSGTPKLIPLSKSFLKRNHQLGAKTVLALYLSQNRQSKLFSHYTLAFGAGHILPRTGRWPCNPMCLSLILTSTRPRLYNWVALPSQNIAYITDWEQKKEAITKATAGCSISAFFGMAANFTVAMRHTLQKSGASNLRQLYPHFELIVHGGAPYGHHKKLVEDLVGDNRFHTCETYNASEGFFAIEYPLGSQQLALLLKHDVFYEFKTAQSVCSLQDVKVGVEYELVITTPDGLVRYQTQDIVVFTQVRPYRLKVLGRGSCSLNLVCEKLTEWHARAAIEKAAAATGARVEFFTAGPANSPDYQHEWAVSFANPPSSDTDFCKALDNWLCENNSEYAGAREHKLKAPIMQKLPRSAFEKHLARRNQEENASKLKPLSSDRSILESLHN